MIDVDSWQIKT